MSAIEAATTYAVPLPPPQPRRATLLAEALRAWWKEEAEDWDQQVTGAVADLPDELDVWNDMPTVDSKAVARTSPIFKKYLGIPLDSKLIRAGGYKSIENVIDHLVPLMEEAAKKKQSAVAEKEAR